MIAERGSMTMAMTGVMAIVIVVGVAVAGLTALYAAKTRAENAADAAALAAAVSTYPAATSSSPLASARDMASRNGATLVRCECAVDGRLSPRTVLVTVVTEARLPVFGSMSVRASSRAEFDPGEWLGL